MKNKILYVLLGVMVVLNVGLIIFVGGERNCECEIPEKTEKEILEEKYMELNNKIVEYLNDIYNTEEYMNGSLEPATYMVTLEEFQKKGYDISMFVNPVTKKQCDLKESYGRFIIIGTKKDGTTDYTYNTNLYCEEQ